MRALVISLTLGLLLVVAGCAGAPMPVNGMIFADVSGPYMATTNTKGSKEGKTECTSILGLVASGDCSIAAAMANGNITKVATVDYHTWSILGLYARVNTVVTGE